MLIDLVQQYDQEKTAFFHGLWEKCVLQLALHHDHKKIVSFLAKVGIVDIDEKEKVVYVGVANEFVLTQVKKFFQKDIKEAIQVVYHPQFTVKFLLYSPFLQGSPLLLNLKDVLHVKDDPKQEIREIRKEIKKDISDYFGILFDPIHRFDSFVVGAHNNIAFSSAKAVAEQPGVVYNPLFLYGNVGLGKTHLMQAIGNEIMHNFPEKVVVYLPATKLIDEIVSAVRGNKISHLLKKFEEVDVLMIDDIQFVSEKEKTQEIFHNIFNDLQLQKKQIVLSSDRPPKELLYIEPRLRSRFALGLVADIKSPDFETRVAILQSKLAQKGECIDDQFLEIVAKYVKDNVRELEGALNLLLTRKKVLHEEIGEEQVLACLHTLGYAKDSGTDGAGGSFAQQNTKGALSFGSIVERVAQYYNVSVEELKSAGRKKEISEARQILMCLAKKYFHWTLEKIGDYFGGKNHASVIYAIDNIEKKLKSDTDLQRDWQVFVEWVEG